MGTDRRLRMGCRQRSQEPGKAWREHPPGFTTEAEERAWWENHDSSEHVDWGQAEQVRFPALKPSTRTISLRLPEGMLERIKIEANRRDVPYQSLIKTWLADRLDRE